jgi:LL-diaminopimelate aminotransferase
MNLFQQIKAVTSEAQKRGVQVIKLSIGVPSGAAFMKARMATAKAIMSEDESMHEYQDNGSPGVPDFAKRFVAGHLRNILDDKEVDYLPTPGTKPMLGLIPKACGEGLKVVATTTKPGYPTPKDWCLYWGKRVFEPDINSGNNFLFWPESLGRNWLLNLVFGKVGLVMTNYPHNPSGAVASRSWWKMLCSYCEAHDIRLFNDAAYAALNYGEDSCLLSEVAPDFKYLSWAEALSYSKLGNGTGGRIAAIAGSRDFVGDIKTIKGNTDSGFAAPMAVGALEVVEHDKESIRKVRDTYQRRMSLLCKIMTGIGMRLTTEPRAGFFSLWQTPKHVFDKEVKTAKEFNFAMIEGDGKVGVVGVHFPPYMRYSVAYEDIEARADEIEAVFKHAQVSYK